MLRIQKTACLVLLATLVLSGCAVNKPLYGWGPYEPQTYAYFKGESPEAQVVVLEKHLADIKGKGEKPPPGLYAHLGMLYSKTGRDSEVAGMFEAEKRLYPESTVFLNNLVSGFKDVK